MIVPIKTFARISQDSVGQVLFTSETMQEDPVIRFSIQYTTGYYSNVITGFKTPVERQRYFLKMPLKDIALRARKEAEHILQQTDNSKIVSLNKK